ncbi:MAG: proprotein convertase P-domain-containing protein [Beijerinckiaceae bacterium]
MATVSKTVNGPVAIPDNTLAGITSVASISGIPTGVFLREIRVTVNITHPFDSDLDIYLSDPDGNQIELSTDNGDIGDNYINTVFVDSAATAIAGLGSGSAPFTGIFRPEGALSTLYPGVINGNWSLKVVDDFGADMGTLNNWTIDLSFGEPSRDIFLSVTNDSRSTVTASRTGIYSVSWSDSTTQNGNVSNLILSADGTSILAGVGIGGTPVQSSPAAAFLSNGNHALAAVTNINGNKDVELKIKTGATFGTFVTEQIFAQGGDQVSPMMAELTNGNLILAFVDVATNTLQGRIFNTTTNVSGPVLFLSEAGFPVSTSPDPSLQQASLIALSGGGFAISYHTSSTEGATRFFDASGTSGSATQKINYGAAPHGAPALAQLNTGEVLMLQAQESSLLAHRFSAAGVFTSFHNIGALANVPGNEFHNLRAVTLLDGRVMIVGSSLLEGGITNSDIWGVVVKPDATLDGSWFKINGDIQAGAQSAPDIALLADGRVIVTWTDHNAFSGDITQQIIDLRNTGVNLTGTGTLDETWEASRFADVFNGGAGSDTLSYASASTGAGILFYMLAANLNGGDAAGDTYSGLENIKGTAANDRIYMDNNDNAVTGNGGVLDTVELYAGNDRYIGGNGFDYVLGGAGNDTIHVGEGGSLIYGEGDNDTITAAAGSNSLYGGAGLDTITGGINQDVIFGGTEADTLNGDNGDDFIFGEDGDDTIDGGSGNDQMQGGIGMDTINGGVGVDVIQGNAGNDIIIGGIDDDFIFGDDGEDMLNGGSGNDQVFGGANNDVLSGDLGIDILNGGDGDDILQDVLGFELTFMIGGNGNDTLRSTHWQDQMWGGTGSVDTGNDQFVFAGDNGFDIIFDFQAGAGIGDQILLVGTGITSFAQLQSENSIGQAGGYAQINLSPGNFIFLAGVNSTDLVADDFLFV